MFFFFFNRDDKGLREARGGVEVIGYSKTRSTGINLIPSMSRAIKGGI